MILKILTKFFKDTNHTLPSPSLRSTPTHCQHNCKSFGTYSSPMASGRSREYSESPCTDMGTISPPARSRSPALSAAFTPQRSMTSYLKCISAPPIGHHNATFAYHILQLRSHICQVLLHHSSCSPKRSSRTRTLSDALADAAR